MKAPHTQSGLLAHLTHTKYVHKHKYSNVHIYMGLAGHSPQRLPHPGSVLGGGSQGAGTRRQEPGGGRGPAPLSSQHRQRVLSLLSGAGGQGPDPSDPSAAAPSLASPRTLLCLPFSSSLWLFPSPAPPPLRVSLLLSPCVFVSPSARREVGPHALESLWPLCPLPGPYRRLGLRCSSAEVLLPLAGSLLGVGAKLQPSPGQPCWIRMSAHSWLPARRA